MERIKGFLKLIYHSIKRPEMAILPGQIAFFLVLSVIPIIAIIAVLTSKLSIPMNLAIEFAKTNFPSQVNAILVPFLKTSSETGNIFFYIIVGFYLSSGGSKAVIVASNTIYNIKGQNVLFRRIKAIVMTILLVLSFIFILIVIGFGNSIVRLVLNLKIFSTFGDNIYYLYLILKWPTAFFIILFMIKLIYTLAPDKKIKSKYVNKGALFTTVCWLLVTLLYSYYATNIANYKLFYGNLSNIIVFMIWIYFLASIFVIGIAINDTSYEMEINKQ